MTRVIATATRVVGEQQQQGRWRRGRLWWAKMRLVATAMRLAGDNEDEGGMGMATVKRMSGEQRQQQQKGQW
jgi:hypothetical protein